MPSLKAPLQVKSSRRIVKNKPLMQIVEKQ